MTASLQFVSPGRSGKVLLVVDHEGVESPLFNTAAKRLAWADIAGAEVASRRGALVLRLQLKGAGPALCVFPLARLEPMERERLVDVLQQRLGGGTNALTEERLFAQRLKALAPRTWVTWGIVAVNIAAWAGTLVAGADPLQPTAAQLLALGGNTASAVQQGQWWRLLTGAFLHIGVVHLAMNMLGLLLIAPMVERIYGHRLFLLLYLGSALAGSAASLHFSARTGVAVGASGAVFGVAGALLMAVFHHRQRLPLLFGRRTLGGIGFFVLYSLIQGLAPGVDNAAHIGGLLAGLALAFTLPERFDLERFHRSVGTRAALAALFIAASTTLIVVSAPRAPLDLGAVLAANAVVEHGLQEFSRAMKELQQEARDVRAGKLAELESDERSRRVHAPRFRRLVLELSAISLPADDPRAPLLAATLQVSQLLLELLAMESRVVDGKPVSVDPARSAAISRELEALNTLMVKLAAQLKHPRR